MKEFFAGLLHTMDAEHRAAVAHKSFTALDRYAICVCVGGGRQGVDAWEARACGECSFECGWEVGEEIQVRPLVAHKSFNVLDRYAT